MRVDLATEAAPDRLETDICIIGAGAAGITIALQLGHSGRSVVLLEAGGEGYDPDVQDDYAGDSIGRPYFAHDDSRLRFFGGTTNHWGGMCRDLEAVDFEPRDGLPDHEWPFRLEDLQPWYTAAHPVVDLGPPTFDVDFWEEMTGRRRLALGERIETRVIQTSPPTRFGEAYGAELDAMPTVTIVLNAPVVGMRTDGAGRLGRVEVALPDGGRMPVLAGHYVLACGGIENARLLLNATNDNPAGLGNSHDLVGRYFNDHITIRSGLAMLTPAADVDPYTPDHKPRVPREQLGGLPPGDPVPVRFFLVPNPEILRSEGLANVSAHFLPRTYRYEFSMAREAAFGLVDDIAGWELQNRTEDHLGDLQAHADSVIPAMMQAFGIGDIAREAYRLATIKMTVEQTPNRDSRVLLGEDVDRHGLRRPRLDWQWSELEKRSVVRFHEILAEEMGAAGLGRVRIDLPDDAVTLGPWRERAPDGALSGVSAGRHHMSTTRMHDDPRRGVVDSNCRVHEIENLYVAGSSVFPTGGLWNPTLTIVALALRLADHLRTQTS